MFKSIISPGINISHTLGNASSKICSKMIPCSYFSTSKQDRKLQKDFNTNFGADNPLISGSDYSSLDGKEVPLTYKAMRRRNVQIKHATDILRMLRELEELKQKNRMEAVAFEQERTETIQTKLKSKAGVSIDSSSGLVVPPSAKSRRNRKSS